MNLCVVKSGVEHTALVLGAALYGDAVERASPLVVTLFHNLLKLEAVLLGVEVLASVVDRHERHAYLHFHLIALDTIVRHIIAYIVASHVTTVARIELVLALVGVPLSLSVAESWLLLPHAVSRGLLAHTNDEVHREHRLRVVAERA